MNSFENEWQALRNWLKKEHERIDCDFSSGHTLDGAHTEETGKLMAEYRKRAREILTRYGKD